MRPAALSADGCARLVAAALGGAPSPAFRDACHELTGGNPLLMRGLLTTLAARRRQWEPTRMSRTCAG